MSEERCEHVEAVAQISAQLDAAHQVAAALVAEVSTLRHKLSQASARILFLACEADQLRKRAEAFEEMRGTDRDAFSLQRRLRAAKDKLRDLTITDADHSALRYAARLIARNPVAGCVDNISTKHTAQVDAARAVIARLLGDKT